MSGHGTIPSSTSKLLQPNRFNQQAGPIINQQAGPIINQQAGSIINQQNWLAQSSTSKLVQSSTSKLVWFKAGLLYLTRTSCNSNIFRFTIGDGILQGEQVGMLWLFRRDSAQVALRHRDVFGNSNDSRAVKESRSVFEDLGLQSFDGVPVDWHLWHCAPLEVDPEQVASGIIGPSGLHRSFEDSLDEHCLTRVNI